MSWFKSAPEPIVYRLQVVAPDGKVIKSRPLRIHLEELMATEYRGHADGIDLAREAIFHAGLWPLREMQEKAKKEKRA